MSRRRKGKINQMLADMKAGAEARMANEVDQAAEDALVQANTPESSKQDEKPAKEKKKIFTKKRLVLAGKVAGIAGAIVGAFVAGRATAGGSGSAPTADTPAATVPEAPVQAPVNDPTIGG